MAALDTDYVAWTEETARRVREGRFDEIDLRVLAEQIESLGSSERGEVDNRLTQLLLHLLKWRYQPDYRARYGDKSWRVSITNQRIGLGRAFTRSPSLRRYALDQLPDLYADAVKLAEVETGLSGTFPAECPFTIEQALDNEYYPAT